MAGNEIASIHSAANKKESAPVLKKQNGTIGAVNFVARFEHYPRLQSGTNPGSSVPFEWKIY